MIKNKILLPAILILACMACQNEAGERIYEDNEGILPSSTEQIADVFELKYGEKKECIYNNRTFRFSIEDIEDNTLNCSVMYLPDVDFDLIRIHAYLRVETDGEVFRFKVSSKICGTNRYTGEDPDSNIRDVWNLFESWDPSDHRFLPRFDDQFENWFGEGTLLNTSLSIFMAKGHTRVVHNQENNKSIYKFIFIITN
jgi:hypothetical protein